MLAGMSAPVAWLERPIWRSAPFGALDRDAPAPRAPLARPSGVRVKIFSCHHAVPARPARGGLFTSLVSGVRAAADGSYLGDLDGVNIAALNTHSEMRHQYFVWRNLLCHYDYVGFEHYRRPFFIDPLPVDDLEQRFPAVLGLRQWLAHDVQSVWRVVDPATADAYRDMRDGLDETVSARVAAWIATADVITLRPAAQALDAQWRETPLADRWDDLVAAVRNTRYFASRACRVDFSLTGPVYCNMYILRAGLFADYMAFWADCMAYLQRRVGPGERILGHFAERVFNFWLYQKRIEQPLLRVRTLPHLLELPAAAAG